MSRPAGAPDTIVLLHGFWVTPRSWEHWIDHYQARGFRVLAPAYPGFEVEVEALNADPSPIEALTVPAIVEHLESVIGELDSPPIVMGHSAGGAFTQVLLDHGFGAAGVAINSAPTEGVAVVPLVAGQGDLPGAQEPRQSPPRGRLHVRAVALRLHQHLQRGAVARALRALPRPGVGLDLLGQRAGQRPSRPRRHLRRLPQRRPGAAAVHLRQRGPPHAAQDPAVQRQALQVRHGHRDHGVRGRRTCCPRRTVGGGRRLRAGLGARATRRQAAATSA